ncbi:hypothetical protein [Phaffia rhodozyma]|uniref:Ribosome biogenesis protein SLX9 n=1 Tax=Phaffia rhodozyma TaxID=264483 RepID=A0A0F7SF35_PHARH|nr:hypothetical protein [Phaffia rhodozyma]
MPKQTPFSRQQRQARQAGSGSSTLKSSTLTGQDKPLVTGSVTAPGFDFNSLMGQSASSAIQSLGTLSAPAPQLTKKEKQTAKRQALLKRLDPSPSSPYPISASAARRMKRKQKERLAGGTMDDLTLALTNTVQADDNTEEDEDEVENKAENKANRQQADRKSATSAGKIGEGSGKGLSAKQRNKALQTEAARLPQIQAHPAFKASPWETIRLHAQNSVQMKKPVAKQSKKVAVEGGGMDGIES